MILSTTEGGRMAQWIDKKIKSKYKNQQLIKKQSNQKREIVLLGGLVEEIQVLALQKRPPSQDTTTPI